MNKFLERLELTVVLIVLLVGLTSQVKAADVEIYAFPEGEHMSHITQHAPFTSSPTAYGANMLGVGLGMSYGRFNLELVDSYNFSPHWSAINSYGEIVGPREEFSLRVKYKVTLWSSQ